MPGSSITPTRIQPRWHSIEFLQLTLDREATKRHLDAFERTSRCDQNAERVALETPSDWFHWRPTLLRDYPNVGGAPRPQPHSRRGAQQALSGAGRRTDIGRRCGR